MSVYLNENKNTVDKQDIKILRASDSFCVDFYKNHSGDKHVSQIRAQKKRKDAHGEYTDEVGIPIDARFETHLGHGIGKEHGLPFDVPWNEPFHKCFFYFPHARHCGTRRGLLAVSHFLRAGDKLTALYSFSSGSGYLEGALSTVKSESGGGLVHNARLYESVLALMIERGNQVYEFPLERRICPANSASPIKPVASYIW